MSSTIPTPTRDRSPAKYVSLTPLQYIIDPHSPKDLYHDPALLELKICWDFDCDKKTKHLKNKFTIKYDYTYRDLIETRFKNIPGERKIRGALIKHILRYLPEANDLFLHDFLEKKKKKTYPTRTRTRR